MLNKEGSNAVMDDDLGGLLAGGDCALLIDGGTEQRPEHPLHEAAFATERTEQMADTLDFDEFHQRRHAMRLRLLAHRSHPVPSAREAMVALQGADYCAVAKDFFIGVQCPVKHGDRHAQILLGVEREIGQAFRRPYTEGEFA